MATLISDGINHTKEELDALCQTEYNDFIGIIRSVITKRFINKNSLKNNLLLTPQKFLLEGPDGLIMVLLEKKAVPVYNILYRMGLIGLVSNTILPLATEKMAILQILFGLDKIKLLYNDISFTELLTNPETNKTAIENRLIACIINNSFIEQYNKNAAAAAQGGRRKTRQSKSKHRKTRVRR